jgi:cell division protein FtsZ
MTPASPILLVGVGGAGISLVGRLAPGLPPAVRCLAVDSDATALAACGISDQVQVGRTSLRGLGAGGEPRLGADAAEAETAELRRWLADAPVVVLVAGLGGGIGGGAAPFLAGLAAEAGATVLALATIPFSHEGERRLSSARETLVALHRAAHATVPLRNDALLQLAPADAPVGELFAETRRWVGSAVESLSGFFMPGALLPLDPAALRSLLPEPGCRACFSTGRASGEGAVLAAARAALSSPLLPHGPEAGRHDHLLVQVVGGPDLTTGDCQAAVAILRAELGGDRITLLGARLDSTEPTSARVSLLAATPAPPVAVPEAVAPGTKGRKGAKVTTATPQQLFSFAQEENVRRGLFGTSAPNLFNGEDVDVPTYLRKGIRLPSAD